MATAEGEHGSDFEETMFCEPCNKEGITAEADGFCSSCSDYLCSTCLRYHKRLAKDHTLFDKSSMPQDFCLERCVFHPNDLVKFYCTKCDDTACSQCIPIKHQTEYCEFKHIPSYMHSQDVYSEMNEVKKSLKTVEEEASRTEEESGQKLKKANLDKSDISKSISLQKKYIKDKIEEQRVYIIKALDDERAEFIRKLDERQGRRKEQLFKQQELINSKIEDEERHLDDQLMLYPKKMQNTALNSAKIKSKLESLTKDLVSKERQGRKAELFLATRRAKHNMKTLKRDIDDVREENVARCFSFRPSNEDISIDAPENVSLGCLSENNQQTDNGDATKDQQGASNSPKSTEVVIATGIVCAEISSEKKATCMRKVRSTKQKSQSEGKNPEHIQKDSDAPEKGQSPWSEQSESNVGTLADRQSPRSGRSIGSLETPPPAWSERSVRGWGTPIDRQSPRSGRSVRGRGTPVDRQSPRSGRSVRGWGTPVDRQSPRSERSVRGWETPIDRQSQRSGRSVRGWGTPEDRQSPRSGRSVRGYGTPADRQSPRSERSVRGYGTPVDRQSPWSDLSDRPFSWSDLFKGKCEAQVDCQSYRSESSEDSWGAQEDCQSPFSELSIGTWRHENDQSHWSEYSKGNWEVQEDRQSPFSEFSVGTWSDENGQSHGF
ncbi:nuclear speckle splicing regulatory protein 1-like [Mercenaria mercenaria]|uniref:nuclear speckle splicing regulatory protein 1-like n=1 Tax=Mercenaria mercenaria TaxID=6596 RepID=UPI00234F78AF|nr:nuclear speckle splicing regulatory protein 1-like [Mercenaria mercenaria]